MLALVILLFALFASLFGLNKETLNYSEPFFLIGSRMAFAGLLLISHQVIFNRDGLLKIKIADLTPLFLLGFVNIYLTNIAEIWGIQHMASAKACLIYSLSPFLAALVAYLVLKERLNSKQWLGLCIGFLGLIPIFMAKSSGTEMSMQIAWLSGAEIALLIAVLSSVYGWTLLKKLVQTHHYQPLLANGISMLIGGLLALLHSYLAGEAWTPIPVTALKPFMHNTLWMCLISNIICYNLYGYLLKYYSATFMAFAGLITPFFAAFFGWYFLNELISWHYLVAILIFLIGLTLFYQEELLKSPTAPAEPCAIGVQEGQEA